MMGGWFSTLIPHPVLEDVRYVEVKQDGELTYHNVDFAIEETGVDQDSSDLLCVLGLG
jgi:hypothetical protein